MDLSDSWLAAKRRWEDDIEDDDDVFDPDDDEDDDENVELRMGQVLTESASAVGATQSFGFNNFNNLNSHGNNDGSSCNGSVV